MKITLPRVGMRKLKSLLAVFVGFWLWQGIRLFVPGLEIHPLYIYIYGILEMRDSWEKTVDFGTMRIKATLTALVIGLPLLLLSIWLKGLTSLPWAQTAVELGVILLGTLLVLCVAEPVGCKNLCGLAAAIFIILFVSHSEDEPVLYSLLRAVQTILGVGVAWLINSKLFPYPKKEKKKKR